jgi:hypothetical protein
MCTTNTHRLLALANFGLSLDGLREGAPKTSIGLPPLDIVDDRILDEKVLHNGDDEPYCDNCFWPVRLCDCASEGEHHV